MPKHARQPRPDPPHRTPGQPRDETHMRHQPSRPAPHDPNPDTMRQTNPMNQTRKGRTPGRRILTGPTHKNTTNKCRTMGQNPGSCTSGRTPMAEPVDGMTT